MASERIIPEFTAAGNAPIHGLPELQTHLQALVDDAAAPLDVRLFDNVYLQLTDENSPPLLGTLLPPLTTIVRTTSQDPQPALALIVKLLSPLSFTEALGIADADSLLTALRSPHPGANKLALRIIQKASKVPSDAAMLSAMPEVVEEMLRRWLQSEDTGVGDLANVVLTGLLAVDCELARPSPAVAAVNGVLNGGVIQVNGVNAANGTSAPGQGRLWRLIFACRSNVELIKSLCDHANDTRSHHQTTVAQGRLLDLLANLAVVDFHAITTTPFPELFPLPSPTETQDLEEGLLPWAALAMVDREDRLMYLNLVAWFEKLVTLMRTAHRTEATDATLRLLIREACLRDPNCLVEALRTLPDRTVEEEAEPLRGYLQELMR